MLLRNLSALTSPTSSKTAAPWPSSGSLECPHKQLPSEHVVSRLLIASCLFFAVTVLLGLLWSSRSQRDWYQVYIVPHTLHLAPTLPFSFATFSVAVERYYPAIGFATRSRFFTADGRDGVMPYIPLWTGFLPPHDFFRGLIRRLYNSS
ncbi:hypothetical protein C8J56DRAFT_1037589 [Mycena floridula]|nr:hypothetical protein C8J56DRAFT_1037589 [Mycena floridula]